MLSREQAQALAHAVHLLRPAWNPEGIYAALGRVRDRDGFEVALATLRAAADTKVKTPGVIPSAGPHWNELPAREIKPEAPRPPKPAESCATCGRRETEHAGTYGDHAFLPLARATEGRSLNGIAAVRAAFVETTTDLCPCGTKPERCADHDPRRAEARAELHRVLAAEAAQTEEHETERQEASK